MKIESRVHIITHPSRFQADCDQCGWHTRESESKAWTETVAEAHRKACPRPPAPRFGALMECGCWWFALPGSSAGYTKADCPLHDETLMVKANVDEPYADSPQHPHWTPAPEESE